MSIEHRPAADHDEPPFVLGLLMSTLAVIEDLFRRAIKSLNRTVALSLWGAGTAVTFVGIVILSVIDSPTLGGFARGIATGAFLALLFATGIGWLLIWGSIGQLKSRREKPTTTTTELDTLLAPTLGELNAVRADVTRKVNERSVIRVPLGIAGGIAIWALSQSESEPLGFFGLIGLVVIGAITGEVWAAFKLEREYRRLYKDRVLPFLAGRIGNFTYREATQDAVRKLHTYRILPEFDSCDADDEIAGTHRGLPVAIVEARLRQRSEESSTTVFDGLLVELTLPRSLTATTAVLTDEGAIGNLKARWRSGAMDRVRLEDPRFEGRFEAYSNDQVEARALLTPAFMERFMALASAAGFSLPGALAEGNRLVVALPKREGGDLFEPPPYWQPAGGRVLLKLEEDIRAVLSMADTVIDLDFWAAGRTRDSMHVV
jgi:hypothetical protein